MENSVGQVIKGNGSIRTLDHQDKLSTEYRANLFLDDHCIPIFAQTESLREIEWYFRRCPFSGTPISKHGHIQHCCELYYSKIYQIRDLVKNLTKSIQRTMPDYDFGMGEIIKEFDHQFRVEIISSNSIHHKEPHSNQSIRLINLAEIVGGDPELLYLKIIADFEFKQERKRWVKTTRDGVRKMDLFLDYLFLKLSQKCSHLAIFNLEENS